MTLDDVRALFPHTAQGKLYFNHASTSPLSTRVVGAMERYLHERSQGTLETYPADMKMVGECRKLIADLIHADSPDRIAFTGNTSDALNIVAGGLPLREGDRVLVGDFEFPANVWPWLHLREKGVVVDFLKSPSGRVTVDEIERTVHPSTRVVAVSAVQYLSGHRADLPAIGSLCAARGAWLIVDAIQAVGAVDIDVQETGAHALAAGAQKWQTAPHGNGFLYLTEEFQQQLRPPTLGWLAVENPWHFTDFTQAPAATARRFEGGSLNMPGLWGYHAALSTLASFGVQAIEQRVLQLTRILLDTLQEWPGFDLLTPTDDRLRAGIVTVTPRGLDAGMLFRQLSKRNLSIALREGSLRFSPHFYNTEDEIRAALDLTRECMGRGD